MNSKPFFNLVTPRPKPFMAPSPGPSKEARLSLVAKRAGWELVKSTTGGWALCEADHGTGRIPWAGGWSLEQIELVLNRIRQGLI